MAKLVVFTVALTLVRVDARDDRFAFHFRSPRSAACSAPGSPRHCTDGSATIQLACPIVRAHAPIRSWQDSGTRMPGRDRSDLRTAEEASAGQWVIVPAFSIRVALRRGNRALLTRPRSARFPQGQLSVQVDGLRFSRNTGHGRGVGLKRSRWAGFVAGASQAADRGRPEVNKQAICKWKLLP